MIFGQGDRWPFATGKQLGLAVAASACAALEGVLVLNLAPEGEILALLALLDRLCAMLTRLGRMSDSSCASAPSGQRGRER